MIWDDHIGQNVTVVAEGQQTLAGTFLGTKTHAGLDFVHLATQWEPEGKEGEKLETRFDEVFVQTRKIKSIHFSIDMKYLKELLELTGVAG